MRKLLLTTAAVAAAICLAGCSDPNTFLDERDGRTYTTVTIGKQTWLAKNLNYSTDSGSWCYEHNADNCNKYGRLYDWETARTVCPEGWDLPSYVEWRHLEAAAGGSDAGMKLKARSGWNESGNGIDIYKFTAIPGGKLDYSEYGFHYAGSYGFWWTATEYDTNNAFYRSMWYYGSRGDGMDGYYSEKKNIGYSVRCVRERDGYLRTLLSAAGIGARHSKKSGRKPIPAAPDTLPITYDPLSVTHDTLRDARDGKTYKTVKLGKKRWMAENLNYKMDNSWCYYNDDSNCRKYGRLYNWNAAMTACPSGWYLTSRQEWDTLVARSGGTVACNKLKAAYGWNWIEYDRCSSVGTDDYGFSALPGGYRDSHGEFYHAGDYGFWWTATEYDSSRAYYRDVRYHYDDEAEHNWLGTSHYNKGIGYSVRCIQDAQ
jgi:uncharacterized protein (TIGR02145 family)